MREERTSWLECRLGGGRIGGEAGESTQGLTEKLLRLQVQRNGRTWLYFLSISLAAFGGMGCKGPEWG